MKISILGAGNGGQSMAAHFGLLGHSVKLYNRSIDKLEPLIAIGGINVIGAVEGFSKIDLFTTDLKEAIKDAEIIMVTTTATAHKEIAEMLVPIVEDNQIIVLNPGRTLGAIEFYNVFKNASKSNIIVGEAQSLIYACRIESPGLVRIIGIKDKVLFSTYPSSNTKFVIDKLNSIIDCFVQVPNVLYTSMENIGAIFHPSVVMFNAAAIERGNMFYFYKDMTPAVADFLVEIDKERLEIANAFGIKLHPVSEWVSYAYEKIEGANLCEKMKNNIAYSTIMAPQTLNSRLLTEDIPMGVLPFIELAKIVKVKTPLLESVYNICSSLLKTDFKEKGRTLKNLKLEGITSSELLKML